MTALWLRIVAAVGHVGQRLTEWSDAETERINGHGDLIKQIQRLLGSRIRIVVKQ